MSTAKSSRKWNRLFVKPPALNFQRSKRGSSMEVKSHCQSGVAPLGTYPMPISLVDQQTGADHLPSRACSRSVFTHESYDYRLCVCIVFCFLLRNAESALNQT
ncbi:hypothetical protein BaRGS_00025949 [Batillaria attramentaria]|uniref:Uncharacterized protein n=1 Tax=Batillaria attramentaria TaxID=370345 RepID=A0ABD0K795_9CAEN